jgi:phage terminase small subunit
VKNMRPQMEKFAAGLAAGLSQAAAYRIAYPRSLKWKDKTVWEQASKTAAHPKVRARVADLNGKSMAKNEITDERIKREYARLAFFDVRKFVDANGRPVPIHELDDDAAAAVAGFEIVRVGNEIIGVAEVLKFKLAEKRGALDSLSRIRGLFREDNTQLRPTTRVVIVPAKRVEPDPV